MKAHTLAITLTVILMALTGAFADVPNQFNYQGTLTDTSGNPITGTESMTFSLYADSTGGTSLWSETQATVFGDADSSHHVWGIHGNSRSR